jgi:hypothetical protein
MQAKKWNMLTFLRGQKKVDNLKLLTHFYDDNMPRQLINTGKFLKPLSFCFLSMLFNYIIIIFNTDIVFLIRTKSVWTLIIIQHFNGMNFEYISITIIINEYMPTKNKMKKWIVVFHTDGFQPRCFVCRLLLT